jgi:hypothetical protein
MGSDANSISEYLALREKTRALNHRLVKSISNPALQESARRLGLWNNGMLTFDEQDEISILMDYCIYDFRRNGANAIDRFLKHRQDELDSDEIAILQSFQRAYYSLFIIESVEKGLGVNVIDCLSEGRTFIVDLGFSKTASPGHLLATRIVTIQGMTITTGAALPLPASALSAIQNFLAYEIGSDLKGVRPWTLSALIIRFCLEVGASSSVRYEDAR